MKIHMLYIVILNKHFVLFKKKNQSFIGLDPV